MLKRGKSKLGAFRDWEICVTQQMTHVDDDDLLMGRWLNVVDWKSSCSVWKTTSAQT
jgi:hypothetical protein